MISPIQFASVLAAQQTAQLSQPTKKKRPVVYDEHGTAQRVWMGHPTERPEGWVQGDLPT